MQKQAAKLEQPKSSSDDDDYANKFANKGDSDGYEDDFADNDAQPKKPAVEKPKSNSDGYEDEFGSEIEDEYDN